MQLFFLNSEKLLLSKITNFRWIIEARACNGSQLSPAYTQKAQEQVAFNYIYSVGIVKI